MGDTVRIRVGSARRLVMWIVGGSYWECLSERNVVSAKSVGRASLCWDGVGKYSPVQSSPVLDLTGGFGGRRANRYYCTVQYLCCISSTILQENPI